MLLLRRFVQPHFEGGVNEVHVICDSTSQTSILNNGSNKRETQARKTALRYHMYTYQQSVTKSQLHQTGRNLSHAVNARDVQQHYVSLKLLALSPGDMTCSDQKVITAGPLESMSTTTSKLAYIRCTSRIWHHYQWTKQNYTFFTKYIYIRSWFYETRGSRDIPGPHHHNRLRWHKNIKSSYCLLWKRSVPSQHSDLITVLQSIMSAQGATTTLCL